MRAAALACIGVVVLCVASAGASGWTAAAAHPRIWLDQPTLKTLRARAKAGSAEWKALKRHCDTLLNGAVQYPDGQTDPDTGIGEGYQGSGYFSAVLDLGLCYLSAPAKNAKYGARGADVLAKMSNASHAPNPLRDDGYGIRFYGVTMAVGFDWLYPALGAGVRKQVIASLHTWIGAYEQGGFENDFPQGNYYAGYFDAKALAALATEGDDPQAAGDWQDFLDRVLPLVTSYYAANLSGGGWPEGWNYGPLAVLNMTWPVDAARTAKGLNLLAGYEFPVNTARFLVSFTWPNLLSLEDTGTQHDPDAPSPSDPKLATAMAGLLARFGDSFAPSMHSYARAVRALQPETVRRAEWGRWLDFLYWDPKAKEKDFRGQPLSYFAPGMDMASMRSSWKKDAVWAEFKAAPYTDYQGAAEELYDEGSLTILNGAKQFLVYAPTALLRNTPGTSDGERFEDIVYDNIYSDTGPRDLFNIFYVSDPGPSGQTDVLRSEGAQTATQFSDHGSYAVARATHLEDLYPRDRNADPTISLWTRDVVYVRPRIFVVRDKTTVSDGSIDQWLAWHFLGKPSAAGGGRYNLASGSVEVLAPSGHTEKIVNVLGSNKVYRLEVRRSGSARQTQWVTVFQAGPGAVDATLTDLGGGGVSVHVGSTTVTFAADGSIAVG